MSTLEGKEIVHFLHIGKTGGTAIKGVLLPERKQPRLYIALHPHGVHLRHIPKGQKFFFCVRDPVDRFVSGFYARMQKDFVHNVEWSREEAIAFARYEHADALARALSSEDAEEKESAQRAMRGIFHVQSSYWDWFECEEYFLSRRHDILHICFQENLRADFEKVVTLLGLPPALALPQDHSRRDHAIPIRPLSETARLNLRTWYQRDFAFLKLCRALTVSDANSETQ